MRVLLDTHTFLWFITADQRLGSNAEALIRDARNQPLLSVASVWEMAIKMAQGRLPIPRPLEELIPDQLQNNRMSLLPVALDHTYRIATLPHHHRDPFDRLLIAQAMVERVPLLSADGAFDAYGIARIW